MLQQLFSDNDPVARIIWPDGMRRYHDPCIAGSCRGYSKRGRAHSSINITVHHGLKDKIRPCKILNFDVKPGFIKDIMNDHIVYRTSGRGANDLSHELSQKSINVSDLVKRPVVLLRYHYSPFNMPPSNANDGNAAVHANDRRRKTDVGEVDLF